MTNKPRTKKLDCGGCNEEVAAVEKANGDFVCPICLTTLESSDEEDSI